MKLYYVLHTYMHIYIHAYIIHTHTYIHTDGPGYNDIGLYVTSFIASDTLWHQLIPHCYPQYYISRLELHSFVTT